MGSATTIKYKIEIFVVEKFVVIAQAPMFAGLAFCEMLSQYPRSAFEGLCEGHQRGSAAVCDPDTPRPFAQHGKKRTLKMSM